MEIKYDMSNFRDEKEKEEWLESDRQWEEEQIETEKKTRAEINEINDQIHEIEKNIDDLKSKISALNSQKAKLNSSLVEILYYKKTLEFLANAKYYEKHSFNRQTRTVEIMSNLRRGKHKNGKPVDYYILDNKYVVLYPRKHGIPMIRTWGSITATEYKSTHLKHQKTWHFTGNDDVELKNGQIVRLFAGPFSFEAQTSFDMDYRKEWQGGELVYDGNNFGDTTTFYIVGIVMDKDYKPWKWYTSEQKA